MTTKPKRASIKDKVFNEENRSLESSKGYLEDFKQQLPREVLGEGEPKEVRQTAMLEPGLSDKMLDLVYLRRTQGDVYFTRQDVFNEALKDYFNKIGNIPPRPDSARQAESARVRRRKNN